LESIAQLSIAQLLAVAIGAGLIHWFLRTLSPSEARPDETQAKDSQQVTLAAFIEDNHKLLTSLGVFTALTLFAGNLPLRPVGYVLSFLFLAATVLLWFELQSRFPKPGTHALIWFENILFYATMVLIGYWLLEFRSLWRHFLFILMALVLLWLGSLVIKRYNLFNRLFRAEAGSLKHVRYAFAHVLLWTAIILAFSISYQIAQPLNDFLDELANQLRSLGLPTP